MDYKNAGVDIEAGYKSVELMKEHIKKKMCIRDSGGDRGRYCCLYGPEWICGRTGDGRNCEIALCRSEREQNQRRIV